jgi:type IV fimbrial biogenesis protein FimT
MFKRIRGFTLVELMVTLAVMAIVLGIAVPSFQKLIINNRSLALGDEFAQALNYARSEAVKTKRRVSICASSDGETCTGNWSDGFIVFQDDAISDTAADIVLSTVYKVWPKLSSAGTLTVKRGPLDASGTATSFIRYTSLGTLAPIDNKPVNVSLKLTGCTGKAARKISVNLSGFVSVQSDDC